MRYDISLSEDGTYLRMRVFEPITEEMERELAEHAIKDAKQHNINRFLVDVRGTRNVASVVEQYLYGYEDMNKFGLDRNSKIAVVVDAHDRSHDFIETVFVNAGYKCRVFHDENSALKWLGELR